jgi:NadR type nicotinamide-nucleotide adenylyltransferase
MKKIVVIGPESTGKSSLCEQLAQHYNTLWCPEYAREFLLAYGTKYSYEDLLTIAKGQIAGEEKLEALIREQETGVIIKSSNSSVTAPRSLLFIDTDMYVMKVWCEFVFDKCHRFILEQVVERKYDLYLLCNIDLPWIADELREYPDLATREKLYKMYKDIMVNQSVPWVDIKGDYKERFQTAVRSVDSLLKE